MKKILSILLVCAMAFVLFACTGGGTETSAEASSQAPAESSAASAEASSESPAQQENAEESASPEGSSSGEPLKIATMILYDNEFYRTMEAGWVAEAPEHNVELLLNNALNAIDKEVEILNTLQNSDIDALIIHPVDSTASVPAIQAIYDAGIPVYICGTTLNADFPIGACESDHYNLGASTGKVCREWIEENLDGKAKIAVFEFSTQIPAMSASRTQGFLDEVTQLEGVEIVSRQDAWTNEMAVAAASDVINANPDLDIIWSANEGGTVGSTMAVKNSGKSGEVFVFGTDIGEQVANLLLDDDNILQFCTGQGAFNMGVTSLADTVKYLNGETIEDFQYIAPITLSRDEPQVIKDYLVELAGQLGTTE